MVIKLDRSQISPTRTALANDLTETVLIDPTKTALTD